MQNVPHHFRPRTILSAAIRSFTESLDAYRVGALVHVPWQVLEQDEGRKTKDYAISHLRTAVAHEIAKIEVKEIDQPGRLTTTYRVDGVWLSAREADRLIDLLHTVARKLEDTTR